MIATLRTASTRSGRWISAASAIIASPSAHRISRITGYCGDSVKFIASRMTISSTRISHRPRVHRNRDSRGLRAVARESQPGAGAGEEKERRGADVRDPAGEENHRRRPRQVFGRERHRRGVKEVADVIERHDDHHQAAEGVDRSEAGARMRAAGGHGRLRRRRAGAGLDDRQHDAERGASALALAGGDDGSAVHLDQLH